MLYEKVGAKEGIDKLVDDFYFIMSTDPEARDCFATHAGRDLKESAHKLKYFLSGWLGGPQLYLENFGHPRLRMRHNPFPISVVEAEQWLYCMKKAMEHSKIPIDVQAQLFGSFLQVAQMIINKRD